jgi:hypothetical protein
MAGPQFWEACPQREGRLGSIGESSDFSRNTFIAVLTMAAVRLISKRPG